MRAVPGFLTAMFHDEPRTALPRYVRPDPSRGDVRSRQVHLALQTIRSSHHPLIFFNWSHFRPRRGPPTRGEEQRYRQRVDSVVKDLAWPKTHSPQRRLKTRSDEAAIRYLRPAFPRSTSEPTSLPCSPPELHTDT